VSLGIAERKGCAIIERSARAYGNVIYVGVADRRNPVLPSELLVRNIPKGASLDVSKLRPTETKSDGLTSPQGVPLARSSGGCEQFRRRRILRRTARYDGPGFLSGRALNARAKRLKPAGSVHQRTARRRIILLHAKRRRFTTRVGAGLVARRAKPDSTSPNMRLVKSKNRSSAKPSRPFGVILTGPGGTPRFRTHPISKASDRNRGA